MRACVAIFEMSTSVTDYACEVFTVVTVSMRAREVTRYFSSRSDPGDLVLIGRELLTDQSVFE